MVFTLGLRHTFPLWQRGLDLVQSFVVQASLASFRGGVVKTFRYVPLAMPSVNGDPPELSGVVLQAMICTEHWPDGVFEDAANVIYFRIHDTWHRLYFDIGCVFWRCDVQEIPDYPGPPSAVETFLNVDLGQNLAISGRTSASCVTEAVDERDSKVTFNFDGGGALSFTCIKDITSIQHENLVARGT